MKLNYDENWNDKFGANSVNVLRRVMVHAQTVFNWPTFPAKIYFDIDPDVRMLPGRWSFKNAK